MEEKLAAEVIESPLGLQIQAVLGELWWVFIVAIGIFFLKDTVKALVTSIMVLRGADYNTDDVIMLDGVPARIVRMSAWKTTFYIYRVDQNGRMKETRRVIMNAELPTLNIETPQQRLDDLIDFSHEDE